MARSGVRGQLATIAFRVYFSAYLIVFGLAVLHDIGGNEAEPLEISARASAAAGAVLVGVVLAATLVGRVAVAVKPSSAELQHALMTPVDRTDTLARPIGVMGTVSIFAAGGAALVLMLVAAPQFAGLGVGTQVGYVAFAATVGLVTYGGHLLVATRRLRVPIISAVALTAVASLYDIVNATRWSPATLAVRALREGFGALAVVTSFVLGTLLVWRATLAAEDIELEKISRGGDLADHAAVALYGNDVRTLIKLQRSMAVQPFRHRPVVPTSRSLARRFPVLVRTLRGVARWRMYRWALIVVVSAAVGGLLRVQPASARTIGVCAFALWVLGLAACESFAQEHDRADRLALLPMARGLDYRHLAVSWTLLFVWLSGVCVLALSGRTSVATALCLAAVCAWGATVAGFIAYRRVWKPVTTPEAMASPFAGSEIVITVAWPALMAMLCLSPWALGARGPSLLGVSVIVLLGFVFWIQTGGIAAALHRVSPKLFPEP